MRSTTAVLVAATAFTFGIQGVAHAETPDTLDHGHMLVLGIEFGEDGVSYDKCVDIAAGKELPLHVHHDGLHGGTAGDALRNAGHFPVPTSPLSPWANCDDLAKAFPQ